MARLAIFLLLCNAVLLAQSNSSNTSDSKSSSGTVTVTGCVDRNRGDYVLIQGSAGMTYQLQGTDKTKLRNYLGQRVQVTGNKFPSMETSSDAMTGSGTPAPVTIRVTSIKTISKECAERNVPRQ
jgi:hypothetical protein